MRGFLEEMRANLCDRAFAIVCPESTTPPVWRVIWSSSSDAAERYLGPLSPHPEPIRWSGADRAVGMALISKLRPLGVIAWPREPESSTEGLLDILEACRELYWEESERRWMRILRSLLSALKEQRRQLGTALHRGPAQALTAARLELSMQGGRALEGPIAQAIEQASEGLIALVHGKLRGRSDGGTLVATVRGELDFQARWHELPSGTDTVTLPNGDLSQALAELWTLAGNEVLQNDGDPTFVLKGAT